jgi:hypothetical protein
VSKVILDDKLWEQLNKPGHYAELGDKSGQTVGYFVLPDFFMKLLYAWAREEFAKDEREHPDRENEDGAMTTAEVIAYLEGLRREMVAI